MLYSEERERIQTRLGQRTSPDEQKKAATEPHPAEWRMYSAIQLRCVVYADVGVHCSVYVDVGVRCSVYVAAASRMGVGQMEREDFLPSTDCCHN